MHGIANWIVQPDGKVLMESHERTVATSPDIFAYRPDGAIHAVAGPFSADELPAAVRWTLDGFGPVADNSLYHQRQHLAQQHADARWSGANCTPLSGRQDQLHELFASQRLVYLEFISEQVFTSMLLQIPIARTLVASLEDRPRPDDLHRACRAIHGFDRRWESQIT